MESFAFPDEIKMKFIRLKIYKMGNIFMPPKITQKHSKPCLFTGNIRKIAFSILFTTQKEVHQSKKRST